MLARPSIPALMAGLILLVVLMVYTVTTVVDTFITPVSEHCTCKPSLALVAHRGFTEDGRFAENTVAAVKEGGKIAGFVEIDISISSDGHVVRWRVAVSISWLRQVCEMLMGYATKRLCVCVWSPWR